jgi:hypothetical protein
MAVHASALTRMERQLVRGLETKVLANLQVLFRPSGG